MNEKMTVNQTEYEIIKLLGRGKGGYSYLAEKDGKKYVLKQIHHEPCDYYTFGNKIEAERNDYQRLQDAGIRIPKMLDIDMENERILKEYIEGPVIFDLVATNAMKPEYLEQMQEMAQQAYRAGLNIDYYPTNFIVQDELLYYIDYECNDYMKEWDFENWGVKYWSRTPEFMEKLVVKSYKDDEKLRKSFNELATDTFGLNFEDWYQNGYWTEKYNPYSIVIDGKVVANVSVNTTDFEVNGEIRYYLQLGTVMTDKKYRGQGLIRVLMNEIEKDYAGKVDGWYLFANDTVLDFYPRFGFVPAKEHEYFCDVKQNSKNLFQQVTMNRKEQWDKLEAKIKTAYAQSAFELVGNTQLPMFYVSKFMQENVYYSEELDAYVIAEIEDEEVILYAVVSDVEQDIAKIVGGFGEHVRCITLGFTPKHTEGLNIREVQQADTTLFIKGDLKLVEEEKLMFPLLAHA